MQEQSFGQHTTCGGWQRRVPEAPETMQVKIEKLVYGGEGLGHHNGHAVFVPFVLPEEIVAVRLTERKKKFARGQLEQVLTPSSQRAAARCQHFTACGGCDYQHIAYPEQVKFKAEILRETLGRLGGIAYSGEITVHASSPYGYRNRAQWKIRTASKQKEAPALGYEMTRSRTLCPVAQCPVLVPTLEQTLAAVRELLQQHKLPPTLSELEAFTEPNGGRLLLNVSCVRFDRSPRRIAEVFRSTLPGLESLLLHEAVRDRFVLDGPGYIIYPVGRSRYRVGHLSFFQVNHTLLAPLQRAVTRDAAGALALELYAGVGLFTLPLRTQFERVIAVEANPAAVRDLKENLAASHGPGDVQVVEATAEKFLSALAETPELVILDPPRTGVAPAAMEHLARLAPPRIRYLSCDPATLARDLAALLRVSAGAYEIATLELFDMFPQTYHIETLVELVRRA
jgi:23S rRNA (uracil1939-C5)-methyltransferase